MACNGNTMFGGSLTFDHHVQEWSIFKSRFTQYCTANNITSETDKAGVRRRALLLTALMEDTYRIARNLAFPSDLEELEFSKLLEILDEHFRSKRSSFAERYKFYKAEQRPGEELADWAARVRSLAQHCGFKTELDTALRDRFVLGLENVKEKEKLFAESIDSLTFSKALELAQNVHCARLALQTARAEGGAGAPAAAHDVFALRGAGSSGAPPGAARGGGAGAGGRSGGGDRNSWQNKKCCDVCGYKNHSKEQCRFSEYTCRKCNKKGHLQRMCKTSVKNQFSLAADGCDDDDMIRGKTLQFFNIECIDGEPMRQMVSINGVGIVCEIDSGSAVSVLPENVYKTCFMSTSNLQPSNIVLNCYNGSKISPLGFVFLPVTFEGRTKQLKLFVITTNHNQPALLGRDFISSFRLQLCSVNCNNLNQDDNEQIVESLINKYSNLFSNELGRFNKYKINLKIKPDAELRFFKPRPVPLALKPKVEQELQRLQSLGILEQVQHSEVATPIVPVLRADGDIRICGDFSVTLNKVLLMDNYPIPRIEDLFSKLHGGVEFSKLDLSRAYNQLELDESKNLTCINTHKGLFRYNRLVFGLANAPFIFQRTMEQLLADIEGTCIFVDDILVTGPTREIHLKRLNMVLSRLQEAGLRLKREKCELFKQSVEYLGFGIDRNGLHKSKNKVEAIVNSNCPRNVSELKSFLGMVNYYRCFVPNTSSVLTPLHSLLKKGVNWTWGDEQQGAFERIKSELASERVLAHYHPDLPTVVTADAGPAGLGAVLAQRQPDGTERVVAYASRSLNKAETNYAQIQKEAASIVFALKKFHHYLYGRTVPFTLRTDHKPLLSIFGKKRGIPEMAANRLQRYALFLSAYNFNIEYVKSEDNVADFLSRSVSVSYADNSSNSDSENSLLYINFIHDSILKPITVKDVRENTKKDEILKKVKLYIIKGWPKKICNEKLTPYFKNRLELSVENDCIMRGHKIVIPSVFREQLLNELHSSHFGVVRTKTEARARMWWPNIDKHIEQKIGACSICNSLRSAPARAPLAPWPYPAGPWERVHLDMFTIEGRQFLVAVDAHSKWVECFYMTTTDSGAVINKLCEIFSRFGLVKTLVTDNATNFCSQQFKEFCAANGIQHLTIAPYHPASNGQAENSVKTIKKGVKIILTESKSQSVLMRKLNKFLFDYRNSTHCTTGFSPAQLLLGRPLRCRLDLLRVRDSSQVDTVNKKCSSTSHTSTAKENVNIKQTLQCKNYGGRRNLHFEKGDKVLIKHFYKNGTKHVWKLGVINEKIGHRMYEVFVPDMNCKIRKHVDHLLVYKGGNQVPESDDISVFGDFTEPESAQECEGNAPRPSSGIPSEEDDLSLDEAEAIWPEQESPSRVLAPEVPDIELSSGSGPRVEEEDEACQSSVQTTEQTLSPESGAPARSETPCASDVEVIEPQTKTRSPRPVRLARKKKVNYRV